MPNHHLPFAVYLTFNGICRQAFRYYQDCFGGELSVQTMADTPLGGRMGKRMGETVICAILENEYLKLVGTDLTEEDRIVPGNNLGILIECGSFKERTGLISKLTGTSSSSTGDINPLINVTDKYSVRWILSVNNKSRLKQ